MWPYIAITDGQFDPCCHTAGYSVWKTWSAVVIAFVVYSLASIR